MVEGQDAGQVINFIDKVTEEYHDALGRVLQTLSRSELTAPDVSSLAPASQL